MHFLKLFNIEMQIILVSQTKLYLLTAELKIKKYVLQPVLEDCSEYCSAVINESLTFPPRSHLALCLLSPLSSRRVSSGREPTIKKPRSVQSVEAIMRIIPTSDRLEARSSSWEGSPESPAPTRRG